MSIELPVNLVFRGKGGAGVMQAPNQRTAQKPVERKKELTFLSGIGKSLAGLLAVATIITTILKPILDMVNILVAVISSLIIKPLSGFFEDFAKGLQAISDFFNGNTDFGELFKTFLAGLWDLFKEIFMSHPLVQMMAWVWDNVIKPGFAILLTVGQWIWDNIIVPGWEILKSVGVWIWDNILKPAWEFLASVGQWIWEQILKPAWDYLASVGQWIWERIIQPAWNFLKDVGSWIWERILKPAWDGLASLISGAWTIIRDAFNSIATKIKDWGANLLSFGRGGGGKSIGGADGSAAFGGVIPRDGLYQMHAGEQVGRGNTSNATNNSNTYNITVNASGNRTDAQQLAREINRELATFGRW
jgi:hypothetical protein